MCACVCVCLSLCVCAAYVQRCHCHHASLASLQPLVADDGLRWLPAHPPLPTPSCLCLAFTSLCQPNRRLYYFSFVIVLFSYDFHFLLYLFNFFCRLPSPAYAEQSPTPPPCRQLPLCTPPPLSLFMLSALPCPPLCFIHFCSVSVSVHFASSSARLLRFFPFCCSPSIFPFFVCCAAVTFGHHHYHLPPSQPCSSPLPPSCSSSSSLAAVAAIRVRVLCQPFLLFFAHTTSF